MKAIATLSILALAFCFGCSSRGKLIGNGEGAVMCLCKKDTSTQNFALGLLTPPHKLTDYQDTCSKLARQIGYDTGIVAYLAP